MGTIIFPYRKALEASPKLKRNTRKGPALRLQAVIDGMTVTVEGAATREVLDGILSVLAGTER